LLHFSEFRYTVTKYADVIQSEATLSVTIF
jgi:hypothetical protein